MRIARFGTVGLALVALTAPSAASAHAGFTLGPVVQASAASPLYPCADADTGDGINYPSTEVEPFVAVNPTDPDNIIGAYQQDRWSDGGANGLGGSVSFDGGAIWSQVFPPFSTCAGGTRYPRATDPWVSFDAAGRAYWISLGLVNQDLAGSDIEVATSTN